MNKDEMFADMDPIELKTLSFNVSKFIVSGVKSSEMLVVLYPREGTVSLEYTYMGNKTKLQFDRRARDAFVAALIEYNRLYESRSLDRESSKRDAALGSAKLGLQWGVMSYNGLAHPVSNFSYEFEGKSPFFSLFIPEMANEIYLGDTGSRVKQSSDMTLYFTRAQATAIAELFDQELLVQLVEEKKQETLYGDGDEYVEKGATDEAYKETESTANPDYVEAE